jgi:predicted phage baseplate assembly protein
MSDPSADTALCGACAGVTSTAPAEVANRPGLPAIAYRIGTHAGFLQTMLARLATDGPTGLATREPDDFTIALLDAWATVGDVLTFYQERIANEHYWHTATERRSLIELARLVGYQLRPGVAASAYLAFAVEPAPGAPVTVVLPAGVRVQSVPGPGEVPQTFETVEQIEARTAWNLLRPKRTEPALPAVGATTVLLAGVGLNIRPDDGMLVFLGGKWAFQRVKTVRVRSAEGLTEVVWDKALALGTAPSGVSVPAGSEVYVFRLRTALFGHNAPDWRAMSNDVRTLYLNPPTGDEWPGLTLQGIGGSATPPVHLDASGTPIAVGSWLVMTTSADTDLFQIATVAASSRSRFALSAKTTRVTLTGPNLISHFDNAVRDASAYTQPEKLAFADKELVTPVPRRTITLDQVLDPVPEPGRRILIRGLTADTGKVEGEAAVVESADGNPTQLQLTADLQHDYRPASATIFANVAEATHGEKTTEILGSGDAARAFQTFELKQAPVTYVAGGPSGASTTLEVWVGGILWQEVPVLFGTGPRDRVYVTRRDDRGRSTVQFGDGLAGSRLPTGVENVRAVYRKGIGRGGLVRADQLSLMVTRPLGLKSCSNPLAASGAADPETLESARRSGPFSALTLGRVVSLTDYRDFAAGFAGIAKADAAWVWSGHTRGIAITLAGPDGADVPPDGPTAQKLIDALDDARDRLYPVHLQNYRKVLFRIAADVLVAADREPETVGAAVGGALKERFRFDVREFGQPVSLAEVVAVIQLVPGVVAVNVSALYRASESAVPNAVLVAERPEPGTDFADLEGAELLVLDETCLSDVRAAK